MKRPTSTTRRRCGSGCWDCGPRLSLRNPRTPEDEQKLAVVDKISRELLEPAETAIRDNPDSPQGMILLRLKLVEVYATPASATDLRIYG